MKSKFVLSALLVLSPVAYSHPGRTDVAGCHRVKSTNEYHCHKKASFKCEGKKTCKTMGSCDEAIFYLHNCGATFLDRDGDGMPCETMCGNGG